MPKFTRRSFIAGSTLALAGIGTGALLLRTPQRHGTLLSAFEDARGDQYVGGLSLERREVFGARIPMRAHGCAVDPTDANRVLFFARRPGTHAFELRRDTLQVRSVFETGTGRHLAGHGMFSADGAVLLTPEHDYENIRGVVAVRDARTCEIVREIDTHGIDPHEIAWLPDGRTMLVANGGIMTHPRSFRRKLNIDTMDPSLCAIDTHSGECLEQWRLPDHLLSIRHLALASDGTAVAGLQYEGERERTPGIVALHRPKGALQLLSAPADEMRKFAGYVASVALSEAHDLITAACPYGSGVACWTLREGRYLGFASATEPYGLSRLADGSILASQRDGSAFGVEESRLDSRFVKFSSSTPIRWDDHWVAVT
jgi:uncharacterized protein